MYISMYHARMPWFQDYRQLKKEIEVIDKEIDKLTVKDYHRLQRVKKFYKSINADYTLVKVITDEEVRVQDSSIYDKRIDELNAKKAFIEIMTDVVENHDAKSVQLLSSYSQDGEYAALISHVILASKIYTLIKDPLVNYYTYFKDIITIYPFASTDKFKREGYFYYLYYIKCLYVAVKKYPNDKNNLLSRLEVICNGMNNIVKNYRGNDAQVAEMAKEIEKTTYNLTQLICHEKNDPVFYENKDDLKWI